MTEVEHGSKQEGGQDVEVVLAPRGRARRVVRLRDVVIPDLWQLAQRLRRDKKYGAGAAEAVLAVWTLAHDLRDNLAGNVGEDAG